MNLIVRNWAYYVFRTVNSILYEVRFKPSGYIFEDDPDIQPFVFEVSILVLENPLNKHPPSDPLVSKTIALIFGQFFEQHERIVVYICDTSDRRGLVRHRKFTSWFERYKGDYVQLNDSIIDDKGAVYFVSLILRRENPFGGRIAASFLSLISGQTK